MKSPNTTTWQMIDIFQVKNRYGSLCSCYYCCFCFCSSSCYPCIQVSWSDLDSFEYTLAIYVKLNLDWASEDFQNPRKSSGDFHLSLEDLNFMFVKEY